VAISMVGKASTVGCLNREAMKVTWPVSLTEVRRGPTQAD
jgi:hypothetical protein